MSLINSFTHIQENWKFVIICVQNQWGVVHPWHGTVANLWGRHKDFTEFNANFKKSYFLNGLSNIVKFFTVWFLKIFCIKWIHIFLWVQCSFNDRWVINYLMYVKSITFALLKLFRKVTWCYFTNISFVRYPEKCMVIGLKVVTWLVGRNLTTTDLYVEKKIGHLMG